MVGFKRLAPGVPMAVAEPQKEALGLYLGAGSQQGVEQVRPPFQESIVMCDRFQIVELSSVKLHPPRMRFRAFVARLLTDE